MVYYEKNIRQSGGVLSIICYANIVICIYNDYEHC